jgi:nitroreductase
MPATPATTPAMLLEALNWRYAVKKFDATKKIPSETWTALEHALVLSASSYGLQPWRFFVVDNPALRQQLRAVSWNQSQITDASHLVVFARRSTMVPADVERYIARTLEIRGGAAAELEGYKNMMLGTVNSRSDEQKSAWNANQIYIALGSFLYAAAVLGVDACPMEGFDAAKYDELLGLPALGYNATVIATAGYRSADDTFAKLKKVRFAHNETVVHI